MIKYKLICKDCNLSFDSWFASSKEYEKLKKKKFLNCYTCNSLNIEKTLMSPNVLRSKINVEDQKYKEIKKKLHQYQKFIESNFEYVGENFTHEARSIHYKDKKTSRRIYGLATKKDLKELEEEGILTERVPWIKNSIN